MLKGNILRICFSADPVLASLQMIAPELYIGNQRMGGRRLICYSFCDRVIGIEVSRQGSFPLVIPFYAGVLKAHPEVVPALLCMPHRVYPIATNIYAVPVTAF